MLTDQTEVYVRFNEADPLGIVWHGHYLRYFEDGREAFGKRYGISYLDFYNKGIAVPVVSVQCDFKKALRYGDSVIVETTYMNPQHQAYDQSIPSGYEGVHSTTPRARKLSIPFRH